MMIQDVKVGVGVGRKKLPLMPLELEMNEWLQEKVMEETDGEEMVLVNDTPS